MWIICESAAYMPEIQYSTFKVRQLPVPNSPELRVGMKCIGEVPAATSSGPPDPAALLETTFPGILVSIFSKTFCRE